VRIGILEPDSFSPVARQRLSTLGPVDDCPHCDRAAFLADKEALFVRLAHRIDAEFLAQAPRLRFLCSPTTGHTHIDVEALRRKGVVLLSLQGASEFMEQIRATPEHALGLIIALLRNYRQAFLSRENDHWARDRCRGEEVAGTRFGLIGFGRVGRRLASYLHTLGAEISCYDPQIVGVPPHIRRHERLADLIAVSRVVVLLASHAPGQQPAVDSRAIASLAGRYFVNVARGELVDEEALLSAIESGRLAGCAVDVISNEIGCHNHERWIAATRSTNVIVTPHIGGATLKSMHLTEEFIAQRLLDAVAVASPRRGTS
jgi:D-3-phosphoglycerate dehydrogenase / 2-oxoglutarate reductase